MSKLYVCCRCGIEKDDAKSRFAYEDIEPDVEIDVTKLKKVCWECKEKERGLITKTRDAGKRLEELLRKYSAIEDSQLSAGELGQKKCLLKFCQKVLNIDLTKVEE